MIYINCNDIKKNISEKVKGESINNLQIVINQLSWAFFEVDHKVRRARPTKERADPQRSDREYH